jgi:hypothetical protein
LIRFLIIIMYTKSGKIKLRGRGPVRETYNIAPPPPPQFGMEKLTTGVRGPATDPSKYTTSSFYFDNAFLCPTLAEATFWYNPWLCLQPIRSSSAGPL